jgi:aspartyl-tRNA(Asn)/glutamyl-tRNA(Gln) amidotransferase subunit C
MEIKRETIEHIAKLSMLNLTEEEITQYTENMQDIVNFANTINEVDTEGLDISAFALDAYNVFREDKLKDSFNREDLLMNAPSSNGEAFSLPSVME